MNFAKSASEPDLRGTNPSGDTDSGSEPKAVTNDGEALVQTLSRRYGEALRGADTVAATAIAFEGLEKGLSVVRVHAQVIQPAMYWIGDLWRNGAIGIGDEHLATAISHQVLAALYPVVLDGVTGPPEGRVLLAAVEGEQHTLGLRMAADAFEAQGHEVLFMGADNPTASILAAVDRYRPAVVGLSITMEPNLPSLQAVLAALSPRGVRVAVGGQAAPNSTDAPMLGARFVADLPRIDDLPWATDISSEVDALKPAYRRDQQDGSGLPSAIDGAESALSRVAADSSDLARAAMRESHLGRADPTRAEGHPDDAPWRGPQACVESMFVAINGGDQEAALRLIHPQVVWAPSAWSGAGTLRGREAVRTWFEQFGQNLEDLRIDVDSIRGTTGWIVVLGTIFDTRNGGSFATTVGWNFAVSDGMIEEGRSCPSWNEALAAGGVRNEVPPAPEGGTYYLDK